MGPIMIPAGGKAVNLKRNGGDMDEEKKKELLEIGKLRYLEGKERHKEEAPTVSDLVEALWEVISEVSCCPDCTLTALDMVTRNVEDHKAKFLVMETLIDLEEEDAEEYH